MVVVDMLDRILDSLSEALMHKMPSSRVRRARCLSLATWLLVVRVPRLGGERKS